MSIKTTTLSNGLIVLAKQVPGYGLMAIGYANYAQVNRKIAALAAQGISARVYGHGKPAKYIVIEEQTA